MSSISKAIFHGSIDTVEPLPPKFKLPEHLVINSDGKSVMDVAGPTLSNEVANLLSKSAAPKLTVDHSVEKLTVRETPTASTTEQLERVNFQITNAQFVADVFPNLSEGSSAAVCSKSGDPSEGGWPASRAESVVNQLSDKTNNYINCASFHPDAEGSFKARKANFAECHFIMLDDIGSKVTFDRIGDFKLSWLLETSPGNHQGGIILDPPLIDADKATQLLDAIIQAGLCDSGSTGPASRWARLPVGINGKSKYKNFLNQQFPCRLVQWAPQNRYAIKDIMDGLKLEFVPSSQSKIQAKSTAIDLKTTKGVANEVCSPAGEPSKSIANDSVVATIEALLEKIDPNCGYRDWVSALMAIFHETNGSEQGLALADRWSSASTKYKGFKEIEIKWRSFRADMPNPVTIATLIKMARDAGADVQAIMQKANGFEPCETEVIEPTFDARVKAPRSDHPLAKYSLRDHLPYLEKQMVEQTFLLGNLVLMGQATVIYAKANTGKTLIAFHLIIEAIKNARIDPSKLYYINMDDNSSGLVDKVRLAVEYGFHMIADGHQRFESKEFRKAMEKMIETDTARGFIVVLDTLKKFVNTMDKRESSDFARVVRQFSLKGGTLIALSHTNKHAGKDGKPQYSGTTDIVDDFDCAFTLATVDQQVDSQQKVVEFENIKRRGDVALTASYSYTLERCSYEELLLSVKEVDALELLPIKHATEVKADATIITAIAACITDGINSKMKLVDASAKRVSVSKRTALNVLQKYTGEDPSIHRWMFGTQQRGAKVYRLLEHTQGMKTDAPMTLS